ncbi:DUF4199 domain-containing protein [Natronogracilivirga saccharolytica]|uniref:DUF4199 family protein n=1 Tax=Natronogracilivirga saccharolytica TaxID=2812953 RepID=A0A8J7RJV2_9BACT|nr:DUF4199 domain-containing protein [Natronogracilivirga saccharolytica]MBP3191478.1 DUF4199 family protein [Natronogracilivirga saccharolytica]
MEPVEKKSYWNAAGMAGVIFGFIVFLVATIGSYATIHSEPTGTFFSGTIVASVIGCLIGAFGGVLAVKLYINEYGPELKIGTGAVIGLVTGIFITLVYQVFSMIWPVIDSSYIENLQSAMIANIEMMDALPAATRDEMIDAMYADMQNYYSAGTIIQNLFFGVLTYGLLNLLSGLLAAKFMGKPPQEEAI